MNQESFPNSLSTLSDDDLREILSLELGAGVETSVRNVLLNPILDFLDRPKKNLRAKLTELGIFLSDGPERNPKKFSLAFEVIECVHGGSLIVDDIEDGSHFRRGKPTLHEAYGLSVALNAGNWLYFWPLELIRRMQMPAEQELELVRLYHRTLLRAHFGQALDVGVSMKNHSAEKLSSVCLAAIELKSGTLAAFAIGMGAIVSGASKERREKLLSFGHRFGVALQMLDDLGNFTGGKDPQKRWEDLRLGRPTWVWARLGQEQNSSHLDTFRDAVGKLPEESTLESWMKVNAAWISQARNEATGFLKETVGSLRESISLSEEANSLLGEIERGLLEAYG